MVSEPVITPARMARRLRAVLFVDVVDSVRLIRLDQDEKPLLTPRISKPLLTSWCRLAIRS